MAEFEDAVEAQFAERDPDSETETPTAPPAEVPEPGDEETGEAAPPPSPPTTVRIGDLDVPVDDIQSLLEFQAWARDNQEKMYAFGQYLRGEADFIQRQQEQEPQPEPQPEIDWEMVDPAMRAHLENVQRQVEELQQRVQSYEAPLNQYAQQQQQAAQQAAMASIDAASARFTERFKVTPEELDELAEIAGSLNIVPGLRQAGVDPEQAIMTALETAYWKTDKFQSKFIEEQVAARDADRRRRKAGSVGGSTGSDRSDVSSGPGGEVPTEKGEKRLAMAAEIAEALRGTP